jgi:hypothetical protein
MSKTLQTIADYCLENIWNFEERVQMALAKIDHWRCPLSQADRTLYSDIQNAIEDYGTDYELDIDGIDPEEIIWL